MRRRRAVVIGGGVSGLVAALLLAARDVEVTLCERSPGLGGKMAQVAVGGALLDGGPTVFTMRWVFDEIFAEVRSPLPFALRPLSVLARHGWGCGTRLDLFADRAASADAIGVFAGAAAAAGYLAFCDRAARVWRALEHPYVRAPRPTLLSVTAAGGTGLLAASPFESLWRALGRHFADHRLRQLFARYATYSGASPFAASATLMLIAHVEQEGVWDVAGGMHAVAAGIAGAARTAGAVLRCDASVARIAVAGGRATGVVLADGEMLAADAVLMGADVAALAGGLFGTAPARATPLPGPRSLSAVTWAMRAGTDYPLQRHTVFFGEDYASEFDDIFRAGRLPRAPTVYVCAQDRDDDTPRGPERLLCLVNAPATGDTIPPTAEEIAQCRTRMTELLERCGCRLTPHETVTTGPAEWAARFPATGGALYGPVQHGWRAAFSRPAARSRLPGLYLMGGSTHPGPGVPMAALSGRFAAMAAIADLGSTSQSRPAAMHGGMSTR